MAHAARLMVVWELLLLAACSQDPFKTKDAQPPDGGTRADSAILCGPGDQDQDAIPDCIEGLGDTDKDGAPDMADTDSDGDGIDDRTEAGDADPKTPPVDTDKDGKPDYRDTDSDNDGLPDAEEKTLGTSPTSSDTDNDGLPDLAEVVVGTNPKDPQSKLPPGDFFVILPYQGKHELRDLEFGTKVQKADVYFLMDTSTTMDGEISTIKSSLKSVIVPGIAAEINDVAMGVGHFEDIPVQPYGTASFHAYANLLNVTTDVGKVQSALGQLQTCCVPDGSTMPESQVIALHATITGAALGSFVPAAPACAGLGEYGYPCFRPQALPIVVLITDAMFHNGPTGTAPYPPSIQPAPPTYAKTLAELKARGCKVLGVFSGTGWDQADTTAVVKDSGAVDIAGKPLVFPISDTGVGLDAAVVQAVKSLAGNVARDVDTFSEESPLVNDGVDAAKFIKAVKPKSAAPPTGVKSFDSTTFFSVVPGTKVTFEVDFYNDFVPPQAVDKAYQARIVVRGDKTVLLDSRKVVIIVPRKDSSIVIE